jgi:hypothetical protein
LNDSIRVKAENGVKRLNVALVILPMSWDITNRSDDSDHNHNYDHCIYTILVLEVSRAYHDTAGL